LKIITILQWVLIFDESVNRRHGPRWWPQIGAAATRAWDEAPHRPSGLEGRPDRAKGQVQVERQLVERARKRVDGLLIELAEVRIDAMISGCEAAVLRPSSGRSPNAAGGGEGGSGRCHGNERGTHYEPGPLSITPLRRQPAIAQSPRS
jgi:hypothetical protein